MAVRVSDWTDLPRSPRRIVVAVLRAPVRRAEGGGSHGTVGWDHEAPQPAYDAQLRDASPGRCVRHPDGAGVARPLGRQHDDDVLARGEPAVGLGFGVRSIACDGRVPRSQYSGPREPRVAAANCVGIPHALHLQAFRSRPLLHLVAWPASGVRCRRPQRTTPLAANHGEPALSEGTVSHSFLSTSTRSSMKTNPAVAAPVVRRTVSRRASVQRE